MEGAHGYAAVFRRQRLFTPGIGDPPRTPTSETLNLDHPARRRIAPQLEMQLEPFICGSLRLSSSASGVAHEIKNPLKRHGAASRVAAIAPSRHRARVGK